MISRVSVDMQVAKTPTFILMCQFPLFVALCDHNPPTGPDLSGGGLGPSSLGVTKWETVKA